MIQRIQTIYLFLAGILPAITLFVPVMLFGSGNKWFTMSSLSYDTALVPELAGSFPIGLGVFTLLAIVLAFVALAGYKNRKSQLRKVALAILANALWYVTFAFYTFSLSSRMKMDHWFKEWCFLPLLAIVFLFLARRGILKDEALVRAADRIR